MGGHNSKKATPSNETSIKLPFRRIESNVVPFKPPPVWHQAVPQRTVWGSSNCITSRQIGVTQNPYVRSTMRPITSSQQSLNLPPPIQPVREIPLPQSYDIWTSSLARHKAESDYSKFNTRIAYNARELYKTDLEAHRIRLERTKESSNLFTQKESPKPALSINSCLKIDDRLKTFKTYDKLFFSKKELPELTADMLVQINDASKPYPSDQLLIELDGVQVLRKDIQTLQGLNWLNDEIVNAYMTLLVIRGGKTGYKRVHTFNTFFYPNLRRSGYSSVRRWTRKIDIFSYDFILVPVHLGNHWCLGFIDFTKRTISYYDSLGGSQNGCCDTLLDYLRQESNDKKKQDFDDENWRLIDQSSSKDTPQQKNCSDCGVFACTYAEYLTRQANFNFTQQHMPYFRKKMIYEIINRTILE